MAVAAGRAYNGDVPIVDDTCSTCTKLILAGGNTAFRDGTSLHVQCYLDETPARFPGDNEGLAGVHVLVVEDDEGTLEVLQAALENFGAKVTSAVDAERGKAALRDTHPDVLVSDISMPHDGFDVMREIIAFGADTGLRVPAVAITSIHNGRERIRSAGFAALLSKPFDPVVLAAVLERLAKRLPRP